MHVFCFIQIKNPSSKTVLHNSYNCNFHNHIINTNYQTPQSLQNINHKNIHATTITINIITHKHHRPFNIQQIYLSTTQTKQRGTYIQRKSQKIMHSTIQKIYHFFAKQNHQFLTGITNIFRELNTSLCCQVISKHNVSQHQTNNQHHNMHKTPSFTAIEKYIIIGRTPTSKTSNSPSKKFFFFLHFLE